MCRNLLRERRGRFAGRSNKSETLVGRSRLCLRLISQSPARVEFVRGFRRKRRQCFSVRRVCREDRIRERARSRITKKAREAPGNRMRWTFAPAPNRRRRWEHLTVSGPVVVGTGGKIEKKKKTKRHSRTRNDSSPRNEPNVCEIFRTRLSGGKKKKKKSTNIPEMPFRFDVSPPLERRPYFLSVLE